MEAIDATTGEVIRVFSCHSEFCLWYDMRDDWRFVRDETEVNPQLRNYWRLCSADEARFLVRD